MTAARARAAARLRGFAAVPEAPGVADVATPDHDHPLPDIDAEPTVHVDEELDRLEDTVGVGALDVESAPQRGTDPEEHGVVLVPQLFQGDVDPEGSDQPLYAGAVSFGDAGTKDVVIDDFSVDVLEGPRSSGRGALSKGVPMHILSNRRNAMLLVAPGVLVMLFAIVAPLILGAAYSLWLVKRVVFGDVGNEQVAKLEDVNGREILVLGSLAAVVLLFGIWPAPLVEVMEVTLQNLVAHVTISKL